METYLTKPSVSRAARGVADIVGEKPFKNEIKVELFF